MSLSPEQGGLAPSWAAFHEAVRRDSLAGKLPRSSGRRSHAAGHVWVVEEFRSGAWRPLHSWSAWFVSRREAWSRHTLERLRAEAVSYRCRDPKDRRRWGLWRHRRKYGSLRLAKYVPGRRGVFLVEGRSNAGQPWTPFGVWSGSTYRTRAAAESDLARRYAHDRRGLVAFDPQKRRFVAARRVRPWGRAEEA